MSGAIAGIGFALKGVADQADALAKRSRRLQFPIEELQTWSFAAEQSGISSEKFTSSLEAFTKRLGEAKAGTGAINTLLKKTSPAFLEQLQATTNTSKALEMYIDHIRSIEDPSKRAALAAAAFSRAGLEMGNLANSSAADLAKLRNEQLQNGVIGMKAARQAEAFNDSLNSLKKSAAGLLYEALIPLMPEITNLAKATREWIVSNKGEIGKNIRDALPVVKEFARTFGKSFVTTLGQIGDAMRSVFPDVDAGKRWQKTIETLAVSLGQLAAVGIAVLGSMAALGAGLTLTFGVAFQGVKAALDGMAKHIAGIIFAVTDWWADLKAMFSAEGLDLAEKAKKIGMHIVRGFVAGVERLAMEPIEAVKNIGGSALKAMKSAMGIHSDSREMMKLGAHTGAGYATGIERSVDGIRAASKHATDAAAIKPPVTDVMTVTAPWQQLPGIMSETRRAMGTTASAFEATAGGAVRAADTIRTAWATLPGLLGSLKAPDIRLRVTAPVPRMDPFSLADTRRHDDHDDHDDHDRPRYDRDRYDRQLIDRHSPERVREVVRSEIQSQEHRLIIEGAPERSRVQSPKQRHGLSIEVARPSGATR